MTKCTFYEIIIYAKAFLNFCSIYKFVIIFGQKMPPNLGLSYIPSIGLQPMLGMFKPFRLSASVRIVISPMSTTLYGLPIKRIATFNVKKEKLKKIIFNFQLFIYNSTEF